MPQTPKSLRVKIGMDSEIATCGKEKNLRGTSLRKTMRDSLCSFFYVANQEPDDAYCEKNMQKLIDPIKC